MNLKTFAEQFRLKVVRDECRDSIVPGKRGQIYESSSTELGVTVMANTPRYWIAARRKLMAAGCRITQNGDCEGTALFSADEPGQAQLAIRLIGARQRKPLSAERLATLRELAARARAAKSRTRVSSL